MIKIKIILFGLFFLYSCTPSQDKKILVATASNFYQTVKDLAEKYNQIQKQETIQIIQGSTGKLYAQIVQGAPYSIFFSADAKRVNLLSKQKKGLDSMVYAIGKLSFCTHRQKLHSYDQLKKWLLAGKPISIANPKVAPYGQAAVQVLQKLKLLPHRKTNVVYGNNVQQAFQFFITKAVQGTFISYSLVKSYPKKIPCYSNLEIMHDPIIQKAILLKEQGKPFWKFLQTDSVKKIIQDYGYLVP
ncbi:MAG: molybdate ABC transporter substrate-binding protein [Candidatus Hydrogenedentota bacterium]|nr:MAG: molybdate ABC transporter substrate-binding protein [Candidatus Hydrogenedentota bacterium]